MNTSAPTPAPPRPATSPTDGRAPARPDANQRRAFDRCLSEADAHEDEPAPPDASALPVFAAPPPAWSVSQPADEAAAADPSSTAPGMGPGHAPAAARPADTLTPLPVTAPAPVAQSALFQHLALPHAASTDTGRFEVLGGSLVTAVDVQTTLHGGVTVTVSASVQNASLLDRHLTLLQRRLPDKATAHVRVQERGPRR